MVRKTSNTGPARKTPIDSGADRQRQLGESLQLVFSLAAVLCIALLSYRAWLALRTGTSQTERTQLVQNGTKGLLSSLKDAETGQRGYLLTGKDRYLAPYRQALVDIPGFIQTLGDPAVVEAPEQRDLVARLKPLVDAKLAELKETVELRRTQGLDAALAIVLTDRGRSLMDQARQICGEIDRAAANQRNEYSEQSRRRANQLELAATLGSGCLFAMLCVVILNINKGARQRLRVLQALKQSEREALTSRDLLQTTLASIGDGVVVTDAAGSVTFLNPVAEELTGFAQSQAVGRPLEQVFVIHNEHSGAVAENPVNTVLREGRVVGLANHTRLTAKDGRQSPIDDCAAPIRDDDGSVVGAVLVFRDISERKRVEAHLKEAEQRFRTAVSAVSDILWTTDPRGNMTADQPAWAVFTGQTPEQYRGFGWMNAIHPDDVEAAVHAWNRAISESRKYDSEQRLLRHDGVWRQFSASALPMMDEAGVIQEWVGVHTDISERKRAEEELNASREFLERVTGVAPTTLYVYDIQESCNVWANREIATTLGYSAAEMKEMGNTLLGRLMHPDDAAKYASHLERVRDLAAGQFAEWEYRMRHKEGSWRWISSRDMVYQRDQRGEVKQIVGAAFDLTERRAMQTALEESERRFRTLAESLPQLVWTCNPDGACDYLSAQWVAYTGIPEDEQLEKRWLESIYPDDRESMVAVWSASVQTGQPFRFESRIRGAAGQYRWFEARAVPLRNAEGEIVKWFGSSMDVDEARKTREELEREQSRLSSLVSLAPAVFYTFARRADGWVSFPYARHDILDLLGVHPDKLKEDAESLFSVFRPDELLDVRASIKASAAQMSPWRMQFRIIHPERGERWIEGHSTPNAEADGSIVWHGFLTDVTERKRIESDQRFLLELGAALQSATNPESVAQLATRMVAEYFDVGRCGLNAIDLKRAEAKMLHEYLRFGRAALPGTQSLRGWAKPDQMAKLAGGETLAIHDTATDPSTADLYANSFQLSGIGALIVIPLRRGGMLVGLLTLFYPTPRTWSQREIDLSRVAGERIWLAYEAARATTAERAMYASLASSEERLRVALEAASIGIWESDDINGERRWDARCRELYGVPLDMRLDPELTMSCVHPEDRETLRQHLQAFSDPAGDGRFQAEYRIFTWNDRTPRTVYGQGQAFFEGEGASRRVIRAIGTLQDITLLKQGEQTLRRLNRELEQFAYAAAHDLQEPLRNVGLATQLLAAQYKGQFDDGGQNLLKISTDGALRMQAMVKDLLTFSRSLSGEDGGATFADSNLVLASALTNLDAAIREKDGRITHDKLPFVRVSETHLLQIFQNLISNSLKYSGGKQPQIYISSTQQHGQCALFVRDNGIGIPVDFQERAFGVFKRLHAGDDVPGTGIGLALCRRIVEHYGGRIWIESEEGAGTSVLFTLPIAERA